MRVRVNQPEVDSTSRRNFKMNFPSQKTSRAAWTSVAFLMTVSLFSVEAATTSRSGQQLNCSEVSENLDRCGAMASYSHTIPTSHYPTSLEELSQACPKHHEGTHCLRQQAKCLKPLTKRAILAFVDSRKRHIKSLCSDLKSSNARDFTDAFNCIKRHKQDIFYKSESKIIKRIEALLSGQVNTFQERFQRSCCAIHDYRRRTLEDMKPECGEERLQVAVEKAIDSVVGQSIEFACPDPKSGQCQTFKELQLSKGPTNKTLTRAGTDLLIMLTEVESSDSSGLSGQSHRQVRRVRTAKP